MADWILVRLEENVALLVGPLSWPKVTRRFSAVSCSQKIERRRMGLLRLYGDANRSRQTELKQIRTKYLAVAAIGKKGSRGSVMYMVPRGRGG